MKHKLIITLGWVLAVLKVLLGLLMMYAGYITAFVVPLTPELGYIFSHHWTLYLCGAIFFASGALIIIGKVLRKRNLTGYGLAATCACFFFAALLNVAAYGWDPAAYLANFIGAVLAAGLWLWWKYKVRLAEYQELKAHARRIGLGH